MDPQINTELLVVKEAADYCRLSQSYLNTLRVSGGGPAFLKLGSAVRYRRTDLDAWLESRLARSTSAREMA
ncbi:MAG: helix-turn-helix domain-containing protein [Novosphingobium sp.]|uniref:helix-turn-helix transcriptional regulator n=1 Tax=Tsuneonella sp. CC-YZS046 TaxID=3042152 RepID=UPI002D76A1AF|nr:helix-turn-helix domain-containing protein [Tsuneonella sp. CC-YZS046]WRO67006.1 helix-turn-helix domain-containing protein [Tsuneonella sp. CC-YZS046]